MSGVAESKTTGTPISLIIYNEDQKSRDYETIKQNLDQVTLITYFMKYGIRDYRGGRQSTRKLRLELRQVQLQKSFKIKLEKNIKLSEL